MNSPSRLGAAKKSFTRNGPGFMSQPRSMNRQPLVSNSNRMAHIYLQPIVRNKANNVKSSIATSKFN